MMRSIISHEAHALTYLRYARTAALWLLHFAWRWAWAFVEYTHGARWACVWFRWLDTVHDRFGYPDDYRTNGEAYGWRCTCPGRRFQP